MVHQPVPLEPIRLWPGVVIVALQWLLWLVLPAIPVDRIAARIYLIRGASVMLDFDLAELYGVTPRPSTSRSSAK